MDGGRHYKQSMVLSSQHMVVVVDGVVGRGIGMVARNHRLRRIYLRLIHWLINERREQRQLFFARIQIFNNSAAMTDIGVYIIVMKNPTIKKNIIVANTIPTSDAPENVSK